jgi:hypothetical protein
VNRALTYRNPVHTHARTAGVGSKADAHIVGHVARAKTQFEEASRAFKSQFAAELDARHQEGESDASHELAGDQ